MQMLNRREAAALAGLAIWPGLLGAAAPVTPPKPATGLRTGPVMVLNSLDATISVIDPHTWKELRRLPTGKEPHHFYLTPDERSLIVANAAGDSLTFVDPQNGTIERTLTGIADPYHLRFSPDMRWLVTAANRLDHVDIYRWDGSNPHLHKRIATGKTPSHLWIDNASTTAFVSMQDSDELVGISLQQHQVLWRVPTGKMPADVYGTPDGKFLLVGLTGNDAVQVFARGAGTGAARSIGFITTGKGAHAFRAWGDGRHLLVSNRMANTISKLDMQTLKAVEHYPAPGGPDCMEMLADGRHLLVTSRWARKLTVIDTQTRTVVQQVPVGKSPHGVWTLAHAPR